MLRSVFRVIWHIVLILSVAGIVVGLVYGASRAINITPRFGREGGEGFEQEAPPRANGQPGVPPQRSRGGEEEGFEGNGSLLRGLFQVFTNTLLIGVFTVLGLILFRRYKRRLPLTS